MQITLTLTGIWTMSTQAPETGTVAGLPAGRKVLLALSVLPATRDWVEAFNNSLG